MKTRFQNKLLLLIACLLLFWKGGSILIWLFLKNFVRVGTDFFWATGFMTPVSVLFAAAFLDNRTLGIVVFVAVCLVFLVYWVFFVLLAINRSGAGVASVVLLIFCGLDLPLTLSMSFSAGWPVLVCIAFHAAVFITVALLRRSRPGTPAPLNKTPANI